MLAQYTAWSIKYLEDPQFIVLVATDAFDPSERSKTEAHLPEGVTTCLGEDIKEGDQVPVAILVLNVGTERGRAWREAESRVLEGAELPPKPELKMRDRHQGHCDAMLGIEKAARARCDFERLVELDMLVTHPAYWGRKIGTKLVRWSLEYSRLNKVGQGVVGPPMGMRVYLKEGFVEKEKMIWEGDEVTPEGLAKQIAVYEVDRG
jgi:GNAT superfamily N-acetyltransferase